VGYSYVLFKYDLLSSSHQLTADQI